MQPPQPLHLLLTLLLAALPLALASSRPRNPIGALTPIRNATIHTNLGRVTATSHFELSFTLRSDLDVKFRLEPNHDILASDATLSHLNADGTVTRHETVDRTAHKVFKGTALVRRAGGAGTQWRHAGWARATVRRDGKTPLFEGAFALDRDHHHVQSSHNYMRTRHRMDPAIEVEEDGEEYMVVWRDSDILGDDDVPAHMDLRRDLGSGVPSCDADGLGFNANPENHMFGGVTPQSTGKEYGFMDFSHLWRRQIDSTTGGNSAGVNPETTIGNTEGCPSTRKVALVGVATDCTYVQDFNSSESARENIISQMNTASALWEDSFNISLGLRNLTVTDAACPASPGENARWNQNCSPDVNIQDRLNYFSDWRGRQDDNNSHWTLLSTCSTGTAIGLAWKGQACVQNSITTNMSVTGDGQTDDGDGTETVSGANVVVRTEGANEWQVIAHETGHTYGATHDCTDQTCPRSSNPSETSCCPFSTSQCDAGGRFIMNPSTSQGADSFSMCSIGQICTGIGRSSIRTECLSDNREVTTISGQQCGNGIVEPGEDCDCGGEEGCSNNSCCDASTCKFRDGAVCDDGNEECCTDCQFASAGAVCRESTGDCDPEETCPGDAGSCPDDKTDDDGADCGDGLQCASGHCTSRDMQCQAAMADYNIRGNPNDTSACDSSTCQISCKSPDSPMSCYGLQQNMLDGTKCGGNGRCRNGECNGSSWFEEHKNIIIGVASAAGGLLLLAILGCCCSRCRRHRRMRKLPSPPPPAYPYNRGGGGGHPMPPPQGWQGWGHPAAQGAYGGAYQPAPQVPMASHPSQGWFAQGQGHGGGWGGGSPPPPPPAYGARYA